MCRVPEEMLGEFELRNPGNKTGKSTPHPKDSFPHTRTPTTHNPQPTHLQLLFVKRALIIS